MSKEEKEKLTEAVDYAWNLLGDFGEVAKIAKEEGLKKVKIQLGRPFQVMLLKKLKKLRMLSKNLENVLLSLNMMDYIARFIERE